MRVNGMSATASTAGPGCVRTSAMGRLAGSSKGLSSQWQTGRVTMNPSPWTTDRGFSSCPCLPTDIVRSLADNVAFWEDGPNRNALVVSRETWRYRAWERQNQAAHH